MTVIKKVKEWSWLKLPLVQILVVVANIKMRTFKAEVEEGFMRTAIDHEWIDPKIRINFENEVIGQG